jgi:calcium-translocating P-type ATPase
MADRAVDQSTAEERVAWHALAPREVEERLGTSTQGLTPAEASSRLQRDGPNELEEEPPTSSLELLFRQFRSPLIFILVVAAFVTLAVGELVDVGVIVAVLVLNATIGFTQERRAETSVRALAHMVAPHARVIRDGHELDLESRELVLGDFVLIESGDRIPADLRLVATTALMVDESPLTGESVPTVKQVEPVAEVTPVADRLGMAYSGTVVASGRGRGYVAATAAATELGQIATGVREAGDVVTPLQIRMSKFAKLIGLAVAVSAAVAFGIGIVRGESAADMLMVAVALAVAAIPEGLPIVLTIALAVGVRRMAQRNAIIRRLPAVETLGSTTCIGSDKTGTLTENRMTVQRIWAGGEMFSLEGDDTTLPPVESETLRLTLLAGLLANEAEIEEGDDGWESHGDPTEAALLISATRLGMDARDTRKDYPTIYDIPFEPERQFAGSVRESDGQALIFVKGAPERVMGMCERQHGASADGAIDGDAIQRAAEEMASAGLRVLAMAYRELDRDETTSARNEEPSGLIFLGLQGMLDPPREGVRQAIADCHAAGIRVVMITGDHVATAKAIGEDLGISGPNDRAITGVELDKMSDSELHAAVAETPIYARVSPQQKLLVVKTMQEDGDVVAVTGDGVNDAPALKAADIGISMGKSGTDVAREAADMVLADDNFVSIKAAVEEGRITFDNIRKATFFLVATGAATVLTILTVLVLGWPLPFLPAQLLWLNLVTNGLQDVALAFEPGEEHVLRRKPRAKKEGILSRVLWERTAIGAVVMATGTLLLFRWELDQGATIVQAQTVALTTMVVFQAFHVGNARSETRSLFRMSPFSNRYLLAATAGALTIHVAALYWSPTQFILRVEPISGETWLRIVLIASSILAVVEIDKFLRRRFQSPT